MREIHCDCVERHNPLPSRYKYATIEGKMVVLCPTTFENVLELLTSFHIYGRLPPGNVTKHYSKFVREICLRIWNESKK